LKRRLIGLEISKEDILLIFGTEHIKYEIKNKFINIEPLPGECQYLMTSCFTEEFY
jgi:hypothetical protein